MTAALYLVNLPHDCSEQELDQWIQSRGLEVAALKIVPGRAGTPQAFAYVEMKETVKLSEAIQALDGQKLRNCVIAVSKAAFRLDGRAIKPRG